MAGGRAGEVPTRVGETFFITPGLTRARGVSWHGRCTFLEPASDSTDHRENQEMAHARAERQLVAEAGPMPGPARRLFKADHPRTIDRYIDYFGGAGGPAARPPEAGGPADPPTAPAPAGA